VHRLRLRFAEAGDAINIARLHADSWRRNYRGAYSDLYLDGDLDGDRLAVWSAHMERLDDDRFTVIAEDNAELVGFAHTARDGDRRWGAIVENLHVAYSYQRKGVGTALLARTAQTVIDRWPGRGLYLWVLEQNTRAQAFYQARHGVLGDRELAPAPGGSPDNLAGAPYGIRVTWPDPAVLLIEPSRTSPAPVHLTRKPSPCR
jgi:ribosomal protein S18 acetylase RimI-like enzyme